MKYNWKVRHVEKYSGFGGVAWCFVVCQYNSQLSDILSHSISARVASILFFCFRWNCHRARTLIPRRNRFLSPLFRSCISPSVPWSLDEAQLSTSQWTRATSIHHPSARYCRFTDAKAQNAFIACEPSLPEIDFSWEVDFLISITFTIFYLVNQCTNWKFPVKRSMNRCLEHDKIFAASLDEFCSSGRLLKLVLIEDHRFYVQLQNVPHPTVLIAQPSRFFSAI